MIGSRDEFEDLTVTSYDEIKEALRILAAFTVPHYVVMRGYKEGEFLMRRIVITCSLVPTYTFGFVNEMKQIATRGDIDLTNPGKLVDISADCWEFLLK